MAIKSKPVALTPRLAFLFASAVLLAACSPSGGVPIEGATTQGTVACFNTTKGTVFLRVSCKPGERKVVLGKPGPAGPSAFEIAKSAGFNGSESDWLASLSVPPIAPEPGQPGLAGLPGVNGLRGPAGVNGLIGPAGADGAPGLIPAAGYFYDTSTQLNTSPNQPLAFTFDTVIIENSGVIIREGERGKSQITFEKAGTYKVQLTAQVSRKVEDADARAIEIWLSLNGNDVEFSNTLVQVPAISAEAGKTVASANFVVTALEDGEYCEILWLSAYESMQIQSVFADETGSRVAVPSVILTVTQVG